MNPSDPVAVPMNCPVCGKGMDVFRRGVSGEFISYRCADHGSFYVDNDGQLRPSNRSNISMTGCIQRLNPHGHQGTIVGDNGRIYQFSREAMVQWLEFERLRVGMVVRFDMETLHTAINVQIDESQ